MSGVRLICTPPGIGSSTWDRTNAAAVQNAAIVMRRLSAFRCLRMKNSRRADNDKGKSPPDNHPEEGE